MTKDEALKLAFEALKWSKPRKGAEITHSEAIAALEEVLAQPAQEPVGMVKELFTQIAWEKLDLRGNTKVYITPPQREWVGLTGDEIKEIIKRECRYTREAANTDHQHLCYAIEAKLKKKNT